MEATVQATTQASDWPDWANAVAAVVSAVSAVIAGIFAYRADRSQRRAELAAKEAEQEQARATVSTYIHAYDDFIRRNEDILSPRVYSSGAQIKWHADSLEEAFSKLVDIVRADWQQSHSLEYAPFVVSESAKLALAWPTEPGIRPSGTWTVPSEVKNALFEEARRQNAQVAPLGELLERVRAYEDIRA